MKLKLNFKINEKTENNRIYNTDELKNEFDRLIKDDKLFVTRKCNQTGVIDIEDIIGVVNFYEIIEDDIIEFDVKCIKEGFDDVLNLYKFVSTSGVGKVEDYKVTEFILLNLFLVGD